MKSERFTIRKFRLDDFENMRLLESELEIMKFTPLKVAQTPEQTRERLAKLVADEDSGVWAVETQDKSFIGWFMLRKTDLEFPELGFMIVKKYWGKGFAAEIARELIQETPQVSARTAPDNFRSIRILQRLGFKLIQEDSTRKVFEFRGNIPARVK